MTREEFRAAALDAAWLASCAVNDRTPDPSRVSELDLGRLFTAADRHFLTCVAAMALERAGVRDAAFTQAKGKAVRKVAAFELERAAVLEAMERAGIWHMPLKGCVLKDLYPQLGMRQMSDVDILYDVSRTAELCQIMEELGYSTDKTFGLTHEDHYYKPPIYNIEMHRSLFPQARGDVFWEYYRDVGTRLIGDEGKRFARHFSDEDFYVYMTAHAYKHYTGSGTGMRTILDTYIFCKRKGETLNWAYIAGELRKLGMEAFESEIRNLALRLFDGESLTASEREMLDYYLFSGTYGTEENRVGNQLRSKGRVGYLFSRAFLPFRSMRMLYPILDRLPVLLPLCWVLRLASAWKTKRKSVLFQLRAAFRR